MIELYYTYQAEYNNKFPIAIRLMLHEPPTGNGPEYDDLEPTIHEFSLKEDELLYLICDLIRVLVRAKKDAVE
jgi:hypothetical protein